MSIAVSFGGDNTVRYRGAWPCFGRVSMNNPG